jgi:hypothetical protein
MCSYTLLHAVRKTPDELQALARKVEEKKRLKAERKRLQVRITTLAIATSTSVIG